MTVMRAVRVVADVVAVAVIVVAVFAAVAVIVYLVLLVVLLALFFSPDWIKGGAGAMPVVLQVLLVALPLIAGVVAAVAVWRHAE